MTCQLFHKMTLSTEQPKALYLTTLVTADGFVVTTKLPIPQSFLFSLILVLVSWPQTAKSKKLPLSYCHLTNMVSIIIMTTSVWS